MGRSARFGEGDPERLSAGGRDDRHLPDLDRTGQRLQGEKGEG